MQLNERLQKWRLANKLSREQAAGRIGVSLASYVRWESGKEPSRLARPVIEAVLERDETKVAQ